MTSKSIYHYVYRIYNKVTKRHYYGVRSSKIIPNLDIGIIYFSSSHDKDFMADQKSNPQNFRYKVVKIFTTRKDAMNFEIKLHALFNVGPNPKFYNRAKATSTGFGTNETTHTEETKLKLSIIGKTRTHPPCTREKISELRKDKTIYKLIHKNGTVFIGTKHEFYTTYNLNDSSVCRLLKPNSKSKTLKGWKIKE